MIRARRCKLRLIRVFTGCTCKLYNVGIAVHQLMCFCEFCCFIICVFVKIIIINCFYFALCVQTLLNHYVYKTDRSAYKHVNFLSNPVFRTGFFLNPLEFYYYCNISWIHVSLSENCQTCSRPDPVYFSWYFSSYSFLRSLISNITVMYLLDRLPIAK